MCTPPVNDAPLNIPHLPSLPPPVELVQTAPCRTAAVLGVLRKSNGPFDTVCLELASSFCCKRVGVSEGDVGFVWCGLWMEFIEKLSHAFALHFRIPEDRRASSNVGILLLDLGCATTGDVGCSVALEGQRN